MRSSVVVRFALAGMATSGLLGIVATGQAKSQWDGIYTQEQADRGGAIYSQSCAYCHGGDLSGGDGMPALTGSEFLTNWNNRGLDELYEQTRTTMPQDEPGILNFGQYADLLAFILSNNGAPAGSTELSADTSVLKAITFIAERPAAQ